VIIAILSRSGFHEKKVGHCQSLTCPTFSIFIFLFFPGAVGLEPTTSGFGERIKSFLPLAPSSEMLDFTGFFKIYIG